MIQSFLNNTNEILINIIQLYIDYPNVKNTHTATKQGKRTTGTPTRESTPILIRQGVCSVVYFEKIINGALLFCNL